MLNLFSNQRLRYATLFTMAGAQVASILPSTRDYLGGGFHWVILGSGLIFEMGAKIWGLVLMVAMPLFGAGFAARFGIVFFLNKKEGN